MGERVNNNIAKSFLFSFGFVNCQLIYYISIVQIHHDNYTYYYSNEYRLGFVNGQPIVYI